MSSESHALHPAPTPVSFLDALPLAALLLAVGDASGDTPDRSFETVSCNRAWRALWHGEASAAEAGGLADLVDRLVDAARADELRRCIADGRAAELLAACDLDGPCLLRVRGFRLGALYALILEPVTDPERLAACWPAQPGLAECAQAFSYAAGLAPDGSWRVTASSPDFRKVLEIGNAVDGWLHWAIAGDRQALRSRHHRLLGGAALSDRYSLALPGGRRVQLEDSVRPIRHPRTQEVIGLLGRARLLGSPEAAPECRAAATAPAHLTSERRHLVRLLDLLQIAALLLKPDGRVLACSAAAAELLGEPVAELVGQSAIDLLFSDEDSGLAALAAAMPESAESDTALDVASDRSLVQGGLMRMTLQPVVLDADRHLMMRLVADPISDSRLRDAHYFDSSTGLPNRFLCLDRLRQNIARDADAESTLAVLVLEIGRSPLTDRSLDRNAADVVLAATARRIVGCIGGLDTAARLSERRFAIIVGGLGGPDDAARKAQTLLDQLREPLSVADREIGVDATIGIAVFPDDGDGAETLVAHAEAALDQPAQGSGPGYSFFTGAMNAASSDRLLLEQQLLDAVERNEFLLLYQPQISFASSRIVGMEALIRWRHPELGMVPPAEFIPLAEETGAIIAIGEWVLETACGELQQWFEAGVAPLRLAINISGRQYNDPNLVDGIGRTLQSTGFPPHLLELELTESVIMEDVVDAARRLGALHALGINLAVDDFGTGYSSLSYLKRFPIRSLKVDRSFVRDIAHNESSAAIARAIIAFGSALGLKIIAEGVESHAQYDILRGCGCDELQGYLFSRPVPADDARKLATERRHLPLVRG